MDIKETIEVLQRMVDKSDGDEFIALRSAIDAVLQVRAFEEAKETRRGWIQCSERLPKIEREGQRRGWYITTNGYGTVSLTQYEFYHDFLKTGWQSDIQITAWMPLPEPYKGGAEE